MHDICQYENHSLYLVLSDNKYDALLSATSLPFEGLVQNIHSYDWKIGCRLCSNYIYLLVLE